MSAQRTGTKSERLHAPTPAAAAAYSGYSKHRIEGLTDGIFAVAMTLLSRRWERKAAAKAQF